MKPTYQNILYGSFYLWADHILLEDGEAFSNFSSFFYDTEDEYQLSSSNLYTYGLPYKQLVSDSSISGALIMTGVYIDGVFSDIGANDLLDINYKDGTAYFLSEQTGVLSGNYCVKEINISLTDLAEEDLLFETKYDLIPSTTENVTGLAPNTLTYPIIFIKNNGGDSKPFCFGGTDLFENRIRMIVLADSAWMRDGIESIFKDQARSHVPLIYPEENPYNALGGLKSGVYNYLDLVRDKRGSDLVYIDKVFISRINNSSANKAFTEMNREVHASFIDFELSHPREPRI